MNPVKKLMGQTAMYGLPSIVGRLLNYLLVPIHTAVFLPSQYGIFSEIYAYSAFVFVLLTLGMETAFFRFAAKQKDFSAFAATAFLPVAAISIVFITLVSFNLDRVAQIIGFSNNSNYIQWIAIIATFDVIAAIPFALLRLQNKAKRFGVIKILNIIVNISLNLILLLLFPMLAKEGVALFSAFESPDVGYIIIANMVASTATLFMLLPQFKYIGALKKFDRALFRKMIWYALPLLLMGLAGIANETLDRILLRWWTSVPDGVVADNYIRAQQGIYSANYKIAVIMTIVIQAFRYAAEPFFFSLSGEKGSKKSYADVAKYFCIFCSFVFLSITLYLDIFKHFIDIKYRSGLHIVPVVLLANLFLGLTYNLSIWYKLTNKTYYGAILAVVGAGITIVANYILIPRIGYLGAAWATFLCYLSMMLLSYLGGRIYYPVPYQLKSILLYFSLALLLYFLSVFTVDFNSYIKFLLNTVLISIYLAVVVFKEKLHLSFLKK